MSAIDKEELPSVCDCPALVLPDDARRGPCPLHVGYWRAGTWWRRCGDSDVTGGPYFIGAEVANRRAEHATYFPMVLDEDIGTVRHRTIGGRGVVGRIKK